MERSVCADPRGSFERRGNDRQNFRTGRVDRPERRFAAAHSEDDEERSLHSGETYLWRGSGEDRPVRQEIRGCPGS